MDDVKEFNNELSSLYSVKPPISKAKMNSITRLALKSLKHYKHIVQSIEKFIHKCQPEYKLPGLYVIDSIVRQSRHQFGIEKDPFVARFSRNIAVTFHDLFSCPTQEICKIVRVLNLWQKNSMFSPHIIQPLLDMAATPTSLEVYLNAQKSIQQVTGIPPSSGPQHQVQLRPGLSSFLDTPAATELPSCDPLTSQPADLLKAISSQLLLPFTNPQLYVQLLQQQLLLQQAASSSLIPDMQQQQSFAPQIDSNLLAQLHALTAALVARIGGPQQQQNQQATVTTTTAAGTSALDTTNDSLQSSDFHGDGTSPVFSNKKAGMSDILTDTEDDKAADQMSISSISTPAINQSENMDGGMASCQVYSPSTDHADTHLAGHHLASGISGIASTSLPLSPMMTSNSDLFSHDRQQQDQYGKASQDSSITPSRSTQKNDYTLFSPVSPINSVPNSPSEDSGTPVLDEMPSPKIAYEPETMMDEEENSGCCAGKVEKHSRKRTSSFCREASLSGTKRESLGITSLDCADPSKSLLNQTPEEGEIVANEIEDDVAVAGSVNSSCGGRHKRKKSRRSRDRKEKMKGLMSSERDVVPDIPTEIETLPGTGKEVELFQKKRDSSKKKKKKNKERHDSASKLVLCSKSLHHQSSSNIMIDGGTARQVAAPDSKPRRYYVVLDEISDKMVTNVEKERELKRKRSPSPVMVFSKVHMSRREVFRGRSGGSGREERDKLECGQIEERTVEKRSRSDYKSDHDDDGVKDKKRRRHSKEHPHSKRDKSMSSLVEKVQSNPATSNGPSHYSNIDSSSRSLKNQRSKSPRKKSPRNDSRSGGHKRSHSKGDVHESLKPDKTVAKNRIYRTKSVSAEPVSTPSADKSSRSGEKRSRSGEKRKSRKDGGGSKKSKRSPSKSKDQSTSINVINNNKEIKEIKTKSSHSKNSETEIEHRDKSKTKKSKRNKNSQSPSTVQKDACSSSTDFSRKEKLNLPPQKEKHACISSTTLWIGPVSRHTKKEDLRKELHKFCKPTLIDLVTKQSCVFVAFETRKEAADLMEAFNNKELCGKTVKVTWAPGSGIKQSKFMDRWDVDIGATYIPWDKLPYNMEAISQGGILYTTSIPEQPTSSNNKDPSTENTQVAEASSSTDCQVMEVDNSMVDENISIKKSKVKLKETEAKLELQTSQSSKRITDDQSTKKSSKSSLGSDGSSSDRGHVRERTSSNKEVFIIATIPPPPPPPPDTIKLYDSEPTHVVCIADDGDTVREVVSIDEDDVEVIVGGQQSFEVERDDKHPVEIKCSASEKNINILESSSCIEDEANKSVNGGKFSFSIDAPANPEKVEVGTFISTMELENEADSTVAPSSDKQLETEPTDDFSQIIDNNGQLVLKSGKITKSESEKVILKGKIKFGVKSAFSGWAMKHKMAVAAAAASAEEKSKEDTKNLFESLMERINSKPKTQFASVDDPNVNATFDEDFLSSIKIPSPKVVTTSVGIKSGIQDRKQSDMSDAYDPFEVDSDPGCNSPALKLVSTSITQSQLSAAMTTRSSLSMTMPVCGPRPSVSIYPFTSLPQAGISPSLVNNFMVPMFQPPPLSQNTPPFRGLSMPPQNMPSISAPGMAPSLGNIAQMPRLMQPNMVTVTTSAGFSQVHTKPFISSLPPPPLPPSFLQPQEQLQKTATSVRPTSMPVPYSQTAAITSPFASMHNNVSTSKISGHVQSFTVPPPILPHTARFPSSQFFAPSDSIKHLPNTNLPPPPLKTITPVPVSSPFSLPGLHASTMLAGPSVTHAPSSFTVPSQLPSQSSISVSQSTTKRPPLLAEPSTSGAAPPNTQISAKLMPNVWLQNLPRILIPNPMISNSNQTLTSAHSISVSAPPPIPCFPAAQHMESNRPVLPPGHRPPFSQNDLNCRNIAMVSLQPLLPSPCKPFDQFPHLLNAQDPKTSQSSVADLALDTCEPRWTERNAGKERGLLDLPQPGSTASQIPVICHAQGATSSDKGRDGQNFGSSVARGPDRMRSQEVNDTSAKKDDCLKNLNNRNDYHPLLKTPPGPVSSFDKSSFDKDLHSEHNKTKPLKTSTEPIYKIESVVSSGKQSQGESAEKSENSLQKSVFQESKVSERLPVPTGLFSVPPPALPMPNRGAMVSQDISALMPAPQRPPIAIQDMRPSHTIGTAQEFSKLLNSPVTFDNFSKTLPHRSGAGTIPNVGNPSFSQRTTLGGSGDSLLGPPPPISLSQAPPGIGKLIVNQPPPSTQGLPNDFNKNFPPPPLPQMGMVNIRNVLFPNPPAAAENKNMGMRFGPPPSLLGAGDFFGNIRVNPRNDFIQRPNLRPETGDQSRRILGRPDVGRNFDCPQRFSGPRRPTVDYNQGPKRWSNNNITRFN